MDTITIPKKVYDAMQYEIHDLRGTLGFCSRMIQVFKLGKSPKYHTPGVVVDAIEERIEKQFSNSYR